MRTSKSRHQFYLPDPLSAKLELLASRPGASKTAILSEALIAWIERGGAQEIDERFGPRLDRLSRATERTTELVDVLTESFGLFVLHQLTLTAHQPEFKPETLQLGRERYHAFIGQVGRRMAQRRGSVPLDNKLEDKK